MQITVRLFAAARAALDRECVTLDLPESASVGDLCSKLRESHPELTAILSHSRIAMNHDYVTNKTVIPENAELALIPPVSGG